MTNSNIPDIQLFTDSLQETFINLEQILSEFDYDKGCYQIPILLMEFQKIMNWDDKEARAMDPIIRQYINKSSKYVITKGAGGGVTLREKKKEKQAQKLAKEQEKVNILNTIDIMLAKKLAEAAQQQANDIATDDGMPPLLDIE